MSNDATISIDAELADARAATTFVADLLDTLSDADLDGDSLLPDWTRRHVVAHLAQNALAVGRLVNWAATGVENPMYESREVRDREIAETALVAPKVLRALFHTEAAALTSAWLALPTASWSAEVRGGQGRVVPASATLWMRTRELWVHGVDLNVGAGFDALPERMLRRTLGDVAGSWPASSIRMNVAAPYATSIGDDDAASVVSGSLADLTGWATGRTTWGISSEESLIPSAPRWL
ncbi:maleylpyruvate isomerase family mycothiol-dependent enzyme [Cryobacterium sp. PH31-O1]|uniref:maleylpyruvate isomerase family mycothiol-dependent enzyme n=1 Tax=Cryobacterium sp. PH31-O1 TaxID=3046306 RepID=UPI0024BA3EC6|nr:maleylpyruvate isomerase family mycothiol-dependent enzyme [Cryobacterium sp. PH31-O1]MDJ0337524.1 maleylpyruvate isomerase family mycothiol-dependent enzyme [Cryobacterium sp. PH31-O1]